MKWLAKHERTIGWLVFCYVGAVAVFNTVRYLGWL